MPRFLSCDWGTTHFRLRLVAGTRVLRQVAAPRGVASFANASDRSTAFHRVLRSAIRRLRPPDNKTPVVISGMAASSIGWHELPYARLPFALDGSNLVAHQVEPGVTLLSGVRSDTDVLRGEETELIGLSRIHHLDRAMVILPGTHSKHISVDRGHMVSFQTFLTGELFAVLSEHSVLRHSVRGPVSPHSLAFTAGVEAATKLPVTAALFQVRTRQLLQRASTGDGAAFLSGLLIGAEWQAIPPRHPVVLAARAPVASLYERAARLLGFNRRLTVIPPATVDKLATLGQAFWLQQQEY
ncbi:MAG: putative 2-dehydro-3-deoxygalactonokinase DgoK1 [Verrucomicrobiae bacterium]|nr:putative 2-dehydro-3-deoxygalactonokinase DgoK1 [Verrucomicrobiae bacterium]